MEEDMPRLHWNQRFFASTRGRILMLLRRAGRTVDELAQILNLTDNAVRAHLATLERGGFVRQLGERRGIGKPAKIYELSTDAERLFTASYESILRPLLKVLSKAVTTGDEQTPLR